MNPPASIAEANADWNERRERIYRWMADNGLPSYADLYKGAVLILHSKPPRASGGWTPRPAARGWRMSWMWWPPDDWRCCWAGCCRSAKSTPSSCARCWRVWKRRCGGGASRTGNSGRAKLQLLPKSGGAATPPYRLGGRTSTGAAALQSEGENWELNPTTRLA